MPEDDVPEDGGVPEKVLAIAGLAVAVLIAFISIDLLRSRREEMPDGETDA
jgi:hypothetical protein